MTLAMGAVDFDFSTVSVLLLLFVLQTHGETIPLEYEEGSNVSLTFDFTFTGFGLLQLKRNNDEVYRSDGGLPGAETGVYVSLERRDVVTFTLSLVELSDSGIYRCYATGLEKLPAYNLEVVSSEKFIGISEDFDNWDPFEIDDYVAGIEGSKLTLACRVHGGLRSNCSIRWRIEPDILPLSKKNITSCDRYQEESLLEIKAVTENLDGSRITCESGGLNTSVFVRTKRKPSILYQEHTFTEGSEYNVSCVLNDTSEQLIFHWLLDNNNITGNATQQRNQIAGNYFELKSLLTFFPNRQHIAKFLQCIVSNDRARSDTMTVTVEFTATISSIFASPSQFVDKHESVNITCVATGFPQVELFWLKGCGSAGCFIVSHEPINNNLSETTFESTIVLMDVKKSDGGRYKCRAFNGVGSLSEEDITIHVEEQGILVGDSTNFWENQAVNISCQVTKKELLTFIRWTLDHKVDVTSNATQYEVQNRRGETVLGSSLVFYPKRDYDGSDLTCQWGSQEFSSDTITVNISHSADEGTVSRSFPFTSPIQITIFVTTLGLLLIAISIILLVLLWRRRAAHRDVSIPKCPDTIGIHTLTAINAGIHPHAGGSTSNVLYEDMTCYTTKVVPSELSVDESHDEHQLSTYNFSRENEENESKMMTTVVPNCQSSLGDKLRTLFGQDFGIETKQRGNRLSMHFAIGDDSCLPGYEKDFRQQNHHMTDITKELDISLTLTIQSKLAQRGSAFFCFATVAKKHCSMDVTVKVLSEFSHCDEKALFKKELSIVKNLDSHPNVAEVLGVCCASQPNCVIFEQISEENLKEVLLQNDADYGFSRTTENLRQYAEQVCSGMVFLSKNEYYHPNLWCEKIAVDKGRTCKLYDFIPAQIFSSLKDDIQQNGRQIGLVAPEIVEGQQYTCHTEVWGFGVLLLEMYCYGLSNVKDTNRASIYGQFIHLDSLQKPETIPQDIYDVMLTCRCNHPPNRPSFTELLDAIKEMKSKHTISTTV